MYWLPIASQQDTAAIAHCATNYCGHGAMAIATFLLNLFLPYGIYFVLLGSVITSLILKHTAKRVTYLQRVEPVDDMHETRPSRGATKAAYAAALLFAIQFVLSLLPYYDKPMLDAEILRPIGCRRRPSPLPSYCETASANVGTRF